MKMDNMKGFMSKSRPAKGSLSGVKGKGKKTTTMPLKSGTQIIKGMGASSTSKITRKAKG